MKRIGNSKEPTEKQIKNILANLHEKFPGCSFNITMNAWYFGSGTEELSYRLWSSRVTQNSEEGGWPQLLESYRRLMQDAF